MAEGGCTPNKDVAKFSVGDRKPLASDVEAGIKESSGSKLPVLINSTVFDGNGMNDDIMSRDKNEKEILSSNVSLEDIFQPPGATGGTVDRRENIDSAEENNAPSDHGPGTGAENPEDDIKKQEHVTPCNKNADPTDENDHTVSNTATQENEPPKEENKVELTPKLEKQFFSNSDNNARKAATKMREEKMLAGEKHAVPPYGTQIVPYKPAFPPVLSADLSKPMTVLKSTLAHPPYEGLPRSHDKKSLMQDTTPMSKRSYTSTQFDTGLTDTDCVNGKGAASQDILPSDASSSGAQLENTPETRGEREHRDAEDPSCKTHRSHSVFPHKVTETKEHITDSINVGVPLDTDVPSDEMPQTDASNTSNSGNADSCEGETLHGNRWGEDTDDTSELIATRDSLAGAASDTQGFPELSDNSANDSGVDSGGNLSTFEERDSLANLHLTGDTSGLMPQSSMSSSPSSVTGNQEHTSQQSNEGAVGGSPTVSVASYNVVTTTSTSTPTTTTVTTASATVTTIATTTTVSSTYRDSFASATHRGIRHSPRISIVPLTSQPQQESSTPAQPAAPWPAVRHRQPIYGPDLGPLVLLRWEFDVHDRENMGHRNTTVNLADGEELPDDTDLTPVQSEEGNNSPVEFNIADDLEIIDGNDDASQDAADTTGDREVSSNVLMELWGVPS